MKSILTIILLVLSVGCQASDEDVCSDDPQSSDCLDATDEGDASDSTIPEPSDEDQRAGLDPTMWCEQTDGREHRERERERERERVSSLQSLTRQPFVMKTRAPNLPRQAKDPAQASRTHTDMHVVPVPLEAGSCGGWDTPLRRTHTMVRPRHQPFLVHDLTTLLVTPSRVAC